MATLLKNVAVGSLVKINENGVPAEFYVAKHDYETELNGTGRTLLVRKDCHSIGPWNNSSVNTYASSAIDAWLNGEYMSLLDVLIQEKIGNTTFYYTIGGGNKTIETLSRPVFLLSVTELGTSNSSYCNVEGSALPIADRLAIANINGSPTNQFTRSPSFQNNYPFGVVTNGGYGSSSTSSANSGRRPAFTLPATECYVLDDDTVAFNPPIISGEDKDLGARPKNFTIDYSVSTPNGSDITVTESINDIIIRTYAAQSGEAQTMEVSAEGLSLGQHSITITAESDLNEMADRIYAFTVPTAWLNHGYTELGDKTGDFSIDYMPESFSGEDVTVTEYLDGVKQRRYTSASGTEQSMSISMKTLVDCRHIATIVAEADGEIYAPVFSFNIPTLTLSDGGTVQEFQDHEGKPVFPATRANAVMTTNGKSVERRLMELVNPTTHAWSVYQPIDTPYRINTEIVKYPVINEQSASYGSSVSTSIQYSDAVEVSDGVLSLVNPMSLTVSTGNTSGANVLKGKFWTRDNLMFYVPVEADTVATTGYKTIGGGSSTKHYYSLYLAGQSVIVPTLSDSPFIGVTLSTNPTDYPESGVQNNMQYEYYGNVLEELIGSGARIEMGQYTGTGAAGKNNPCSITFKNKPKVVWICASVIATNTGGYPWVYGSPLGHISTSGSSTGRIPNLEWAGNTLTWWTTETYPQYALNESGIVYKYIVLY